MQAIDQATKTIDQQYKESVALWKIIRSALSSASLINFVTCHDDENEGIEKLKKRAAQAVCNAYSHAMGTATQSFPIEAQDEMEIYFGSRHRSRHQPTKEFVAEEFLAQLRSRHEAEAKNICKKIIADKIWNECGFRRQHQMKIVSGNVVLTLSNYAESYSVGQMSYSSANNLHAVLAALCEAISTPEKLIEHLSGVDKAMNVYQAKSRPMDRQAFPAISWATVLIFKQKIEIRIPLADAMRLNTFLSTHRSPDQRAA